jgi:hypothetical protein
MPRRYVVLAALLTFFVAGFYSSAALCCNADGIGGSKQRTVADATVQPAQAPAPDARPAPAPKPEVAAVQPPVTAGAAATSEDAGNNLAEGVGATATHKRGLRWQSFLPGVIK